MASTLRGVGGVSQKLDVIGRRGLVGDLLGVFVKESVFVASVFIKESWICAIRRHHTESNINLLLARTCPIDSGVRVTL